VLGLAFKGDTDDIRESPAIDLVEMFLAEGCTVVAYDPAAMARAESKLPRSSYMRYANGVEEAAAGADALLILTDWQEFARLDLAQLHSLMRYPIIVDGRNLYDPQQMIDSGFTYLSIGRPAATPLRETARLAV
jgi:UDPglucose 6-dehydrogenase